MLLKMFGNAVVKKINTNLKRILIIWNVSYQKP